ncbi:MAG: adenosine kinase [Bacteroidales bacterium]|nr:adenosine kinase [Bacteroidales bacterium]
MAYKNILGIGNALVDILTQIPNDEILEQLRLPKGGMYHVDAETSLHIGELIKPYGFAMAAGGSTANTISGASKLGVTTGYIGKVGKDERGRFFEQEMVKTNVKPLMMTTETPTGCAEAFVSKDGERTFATYLGAALELNAGDIRPEMFDGWDILYVEGYLISNRELLDKVLPLAKAKGMTIALDMASYNIVRENREYMEQLAKDYLDILFANEDEAKTFTLIEDPVEALHRMASMCDIAVVKVGAKGSYVQHGDQVVKVGPIPAKVIDTTGAGDLWAAGFMAGLVKGETLEKCAKTGATLAANIIEVLGAKMDEKRWQKIFNSLEQL